MSESDIKTSNDGRTSRNIVKVFLDDALDKTTTKPLASPSLASSGYRTQILQLLRQHNAALVAHYYTSPEIQSLAEESGGCVADSLEMARFGKN